jgi:hypothetical protein
MTALLLLPPVAGFVLLAAHFYRAGNLPAALVSLVAIALVLVRRPWAARAIQIALLIGTLEWLRAAVALVRARLALGEPFLRLAMILGVVALFTALAALVFRARRLRARFALGADA